MVNYTARWFPIQQGRRGYKYIFLYSMGGHLIMKLSSSKLDAHYYLSYHTSASGIRKNTVLLHLIYTTRPNAELDMGRRRAIFFGVFLECACYNKFIFQFNLRQPAKYQISDIILRRSAQSLKCNFCTVHIWSVTHWHSQYALCNTKQKGSRISNRGSSICFYPPSSSNIWLVD